MSNEGVRFACCGSLAGLGHTAACPAGSPHILVGEEIVRCTCKARKPRDRHGDDCPVGFHLEQGRHPTRFHKLPDNWPGEERRDDPVNYPAHYTSHPSGIECIQITEYMDFLTGNAMKYLWRHDSKSPDGGIEDLKKAKWYIERRIALLEKTRAK